MMARLSRVVPAILTQDPEALEAMVRQTEGFTTYVQFDIMDGRFVPSRSITHEHLSALPLKLNWEAHLMVQCPENYLADLHQAGAQKVIFHYEATSSPREVISQARHLGLEVGLALNPETPISAITSLASAVDSVLFLTVHPGFYGSEFVPEVLEKLAEFRSARPDAEIGVDGGIKESNIAQVARVGVDVIYVGSAIFLQPRPAEAFRRLMTLAKEGSRQR
jgi:ribulose-phosphate 3-epimerase